MHQHLLHASRPTLGFVGIPLAVPCPVPFFECQAAYIAEHLARPAGRAMTSEPQRTAWLQGQMEAVGFDAGRPQDLHLTGAGGGSPWRYMRELLAAVFPRQRESKEELDFFWKARRAVPGAAARASGTARAITLRVPQPAAAREGVGPTSSQA